VSESHRESLNGTVLRAISGYVARRCDTVEAHSAIGKVDAMKNWVFSELRIAHGHAFQNRNRSRVEGLGGCKVFCYV